jgi:hypothetical protein
MSDLNDPHGERARELYGPHAGDEQNGQVRRTTIRPGHYSDGLPREGTRPEQIHHAKDPGYHSAEQRAQHARLRGEHPVRRK